MPELSNKVIANDIGSAAVALYASAESVIANQLDSLKEQLMADFREAMKAHDETAKNTIIWIILK